MAHVEIETGKYVKRWAFWNPATWSIPKLYWDAWSQEQRIHAICRQLEKVIKYADYIGVNVDDIAERLKAIEEGQLDPIIESAVEAWFEEHEEDIILKITDLENALPISEFDAEHTVKDEFDSLKEIIPFSEFDAEHTVKDKIDDLQEATESSISELSEDVTEINGEIAELKLYSHSVPSFRCVNRFIAGKPGTNGLDSMQAGCVFERSGVLYWAQILNSSTPNKDRLVIREVNGNSQLCDKELELGHGYSITYNPKTQEFMTQNSETTPFQMIWIDAHSLDNPVIDRVVSVPVGMHLDNPTYYDYENGTLVGFSDYHNLVVCDSSFDVIKTMNTDFYQTLWFDQGFVFQSVQYLPETKTFVIGVTGEGIILAKENEDGTEVNMYDYIPLQKNYGYLYVTELEFATYANGMMYFGTFDLIDEMLVPALFEWDTVNGTIAADVTISPAYQNNVGYAINYDIGTLIPITAKDKFKLVGDAINAHMLAGLAGRATLWFESDYPYRIVTKGIKCDFNASSSVKLEGGLYIINSDCIFHGANIHIVPAQTLTVTGTTRYIAIEAFNSFVQIDDFAQISNDNLVSNPIQWYTDHCKIYTVPGSTCPDLNYFRLGSIFYNYLERLNAERIDRCATVQVTTIP